MANIDYGMGRSNIDTKTGIRYGVISQHAMADWFYDEYQPEYGEPCCPKCGNQNAVTAVGDSADVDIAAFGGNIECDDYEDSPGCADYACHACRYTFDSSDAYPEDPIGHSIDTDGYKAVDCLDSDVMLLVSPFYTYAPFCSPCVPGACSIENGSTPTEPVNTEWAKAYCFGHDWFEGGKAPYRVFRVADNSEVFPEAQ